MRQLTLLILCAAPLLLLLNAVLGDAALGALAAAGAAAVLAWAAPLCDAAWHFFLRPPTDFAAFRGEWAVVTGAGRGIGRGYAVALARRGINVVLVSRTRAAVDGVARECAALGVAARVVVADLIAHNTHTLSGGDDDDADPCAALRDALRAAGPVSVVVNAAGGMPPPTMPKAPHPSYCEDLDADTFASWFRANVEPAVRVTHLLLADMVRRDKGYVLNVASMNGMQPCPYLSPYCAAKAHIIAYSACLGNELRGRGSAVRVEAVCPGPVATDGIGRRGFPSRGVPDPVDFAEASLGLATSRLAAVPWPAHWCGLQRHGPGSLFVSDAAGARRLYDAMDFSKVLGPRVG